MASLSNRPLLDTRRDTALFVDREVELEQLADSIRRGFNTLVLGPRGSGKSSLVLRLVYGLRHDEGTPPILVIDAAVADDARSFLVLLRSRLSEAYENSKSVLVAEEAAQRGQAEGEEGTSGGESQSFRGRTSRPDGGLGSFPEQAMVDVVYDLQRRAREFQPAPIIVVDGISSAELTHDLFGRLRDEVWRLGFVWVVAADSGLRAAFSEPPADAFFEVTIELRALQDEQAQELLRLRDPGNELPADVREAIVEAAAGSPRRLIALARQALAGKTTEAIRHEARLIENAGAEVGEAANRLIGELAVLGGASASDEELLRRLGWSRMRAQQVLSQLEEAGIVEVVGQRNGARGRPRKVYGLKAAPAT